MLIQENTFVLNSSINNLHYQILVLMFILISSDYVLFDFKLFDNLIAGYFITTSLV